MAGRGKTKDTATSGGFRDRVKDLRRVRAGDLVPHPGNWRTHPQAQQDAIRGVLTEIGYADALLARELPDGRLMLVDGHLRRDLDPEQVVPVLVLDVDEHEAKKLLAHNPLCGCGCGESINPNAKKSVRYILGHNRRGKGKKPDGAAPLCGCGCGKSVTWRQSHRRWNTFSYGHSLSQPFIVSRYRTPPICDCGCGESVTWNQGRNRWNRFITGHNSRLSSQKALAAKAHRSPETRAKMSTIVRARMSDPEYRARNIAKIKVSMQRPEVKAAAKMRALAFWSNPEHKARWLAASNSDRTRKLRSEAMQRRMASGNVRAHFRDGLFTSAKMQATMRYASSYEQRFLAWCEDSPNVLTFASYKLHKIRIRYLKPETNLPAWYYPDFLIELADHSTWLCEVKPSGLTNHPQVMAKAAASQKACIELGHYYCFVTECTLKGLEAKHINQPVASTPAAASGEK